MNMPNNISQRLLPCKIHYFLFAGGQAAVLPFIPVLAKHFGISPEVVGILYTVLPMVPMFSNPITGVISDKLRKLKLVMMISLAIFTVFIFSIVLLPLQPNSTQITNNQTLHNHSLIDGALLCISNSSFLCDDAIHRSSTLVIRICNFTCWNALPINSSLCETPTSECSSAESSKNDSTRFLEGEESEINYATCSQVYQNSTSFWWKPRTCSDELLDAISKNDNWTSICNDNLLFHCSAELDADTHHATDRSIYMLFSFWWLCISTIIGWVSLGTVTCLTDAIILDNLGEKIDQFGRQRLWGTIGAGLSVILTGYLNEKETQRTGRPDYRLGFYIFIVLLVFDQYAIYRMEDSKQPKPQNIRKCITKLLRSSQIVLFLLAFFVIGVLVGILESFHFWYLEDLGANQLLLGLTRGMQLFGGEMPSFIVSGWVINKIGYVNTVTIVLAVYGMRFFGYSLLTNPWVTLPLELTHAAYGIFYTAMAAYASVVAPPGMSATMQAIVGAMYEGAGIGFGSFLGGQLYGSAGGKLMFFGFGCVAISSSILHGILQLILSKFQCGRTDIHGKPYNVETTSKEINMIPEPTETTNLNEAKPVDVRVNLNGTAMYIVTSV